jgi:hypothetical protein
MTSATPAVGSRAASLVAAATAAALALGACSGEGVASAKDDSAPAGGQAREAGSVVEVSPLTGLAFGDDRPGRPVLVVKIDNTESSAPQRGLSQADLVVEELVEGGSTRYAAFFWERTPKVVGPVRSMRATDIGIVQPAQARLVAAGGAPKTRRRVKAAGITLYEEGDPGFSRDASRVVPYDLMVNLDQLAGSLGKATPPAPYLPFGPPQSWPGGEPATTIDARFSGVHTTSWRFEDGTGWIRDGSLAEQGDDFVPDNVLVLRVRVGDAGYLDPAGNFVPESKIAGTGAATLFHDGEAAAARWVKEGTRGAITLTTRGGEELLVPSGATWIELVPEKTGSLSYGG